MGFTLYYKNIAVSSLEQNSVFKHELLICEFTDVNYLKLQCGLPDDQISQPSEKIREHVRCLCWKVSLITGKNDEKYIKPIKIIL